MSEVSAEIQEDPVVWGAVHIGPDGGMAQFAHTRSEQDARDLIARILATHRGGICWGVARIEFVTHTPPPMPLGPEASTPAPRPTDPLPNPFSASLRSMSPDHRWVTSARELEAIFDAQAKRDLPMESDHAAFGEGPAFWGFIHLDSARQLQSFVAKPSENEARNLAASHPGYVSGLSRHQYPSFGVARIEFVTQAPPLAPYKPFQNPFTELFHTQAVRPIAPDLLPVLVELETIFDAQEEARYGAGDVT